jgi:hypothetical protein
MSHCKDQTRKYAGLDLEDPLGQGMLKFHFVTNSKKITKTRKLEKYIHRGIIGQGTKGVCKERGGKTKTKSKDYVVHDRAG